MIGKAASIVLGLALGMLAVAAMAAEPQIQTEVLGPARLATAPPTQLVPLTAPQTQGETKFETDGTASVTLDAPDSGDNCRAEGPVKFGSDLRSVVFLDPADAQDCFGPGRRSIDTYAGLDDDKKPVLQEQCLAPQSVCNTLADSLPLSKQRRRTVLSSDGWIDVIVVTKGDAALVAAPLRYTIVLHTNQAHLTVDLRAFATMLNDMTAY